MTEVNPGPGTAAVNGGRVVFSVEGGEVWYDQGIYVASMPCAKSASDVSVELGKLTYNSKTGIWSETATVTNSGKEEIAGPLSLVLADLTSSVTLTDGNGSTVCLAPAGRPYINLNLASNELAAGKNTAATLEFSAPASAKIHFTSEVAWSRSTIDAIGGRRRSRATHELRRRPFEPAHPAATQRRRTKPEEGSS